MHLSPEERAEKLLVMLILAIPVVAVVFLSNKETASVVAVVVLMVAFALGLFKGAALTLKTEWRNPKYFINTLLPGMTATSQTKNGNR